MAKEKPPLDLIIPGPTLDPPPPPHDRPNNPNPRLIPRKKQRGPMYFIKVALFMIKTSSDKSKGFSSSKSKSLWSKLLGSVRPLHLQLQQVPEPQVAKLPALIHQSPARTEFSEDYLFSPSEGSSRSTTYTPFSSAVGLNEMAQSEEDDEPEGVPAASDHWGGDEMIDAKAEEFIANFYNEMKLQRRHSINERSLR
ncbi:hypothetical protein QN277_013908 [Acacia crassicarpa]|uniref:Uncharacterized protein n=1 Tax=Acacia crassicarpa TaxID=499986 RepID=A0AAE1TF56_9FABA|nr:hypothetical protein QN277_013908 [Acacia crassicarpa]